LSEPPGSNEPPGAGPIESRPAPEHGSIRVRRGLRFLPLLGVIYCLSSAGPAGIEEIVPTSGPGLTLLLILLMPVFFGLPLGLASGELSSRYPVEGGYYRWVREVFGEYWGFQVGWWSWLGAFFDGALYAVLVAEYSDMFLPVAWRPVARIIIPLLVIAAGTWINVRGIEVVGWSTLLFNIFLLAPFAVMCVLGMFHWNHNPLVPFTPPGKGVFEGLGVGMLFMMWNYSGYESLSTAAEEVENPRRNYIRAILWAIAITVPTYFLPLLIGLAVAPDWTALSAGSFTDIGKMIGGRTLALWIAVAGMVSNIALSNTNLLAYSRIPFTMAEDGYLPRFLTRTHRRHGTPWIALLVTAFFYAVLIGLSVEVLAVVEMWLFSGVYILIFLAVWKVRARPGARVEAPDGGYRYVIPAGRRGIWWIILPPIVLIVVSMFASGEEYIVSGGLGILSGIALYPAVAFWKRRRLVPKA
jgi:amino acid transporter